MNRITIIASIIICSVLIITSCKTKELAKVDRTKKPKQISIKKLDNRILSAYLPYEQLQLKFTTKVKLSDSKYSLKGQIRIRKDSLLWINMSHSTGIPVATIALKDDTVTYIDKLNSRYYHGTYDFIEQNFKLDLAFKQIQALLTNELFTYPEWSDIYDLKKNGYKDRIDSGMYCLKSLKDRKVKRLLKKDQENDLIVQEIFIEPDSFKIKNILINEYDLDRLLMIKYDNHQMIEDFLFPKNIDLEYVNDTNKLGIAIKYSKIITDKKLRFPINIPKKYTRIE